MMFIHTFNLHSGSKKEVRVVACQMHAGRGAKTLVANMMCTGSTTTLLVLVYGENGDLTYYEVQGLSLV
jgi:hypothetical protein